jgi:hypothetical protein
MSSRRHRLAIRHSRGRVLPRREPSCPAGRRLTRSRRGSVALLGRRVRIAARRFEVVAGRIRNMDAKYLGEIERGWHAPTIVTAKRIADALEMPLAELVRGV